MGKILIKAGNSVIEEHVIITLHPTVNKRTLVELSDHAPVLLHMESAINRDYFFQDLKRSGVLILRRELIDGNVHKLKVCRYVELEGNPTVAELQMDVTALNPQEADAWIELITITGGTL